MAESERSTQAAGSPEEQSLLPGQEAEKQPFVPGQEGEAPHASPQEVDPPGAAVAHDRDRTATHERAADDPTAAGVAGLIGG